MKSKSKLFQGLSLIIIASTFLTIFSVNAQGYDFYPQLYIEKKGETWVIDTQSDQSNGAFDGTTVASMNVIVYQIDKKTGVITVVEHLEALAINITYTTNTITLIFDKKDLPKHADSSSVIGTLTSGETFEATGPGWGFKRRG